MNFTAKDFAPLDTFPLRWRWVDPGWAQLPPETLVTIRPLTPATAEALGRRWLPSGSTDGVIDASADPARVRTQLAALPVGGETPVVVWWGGTTALVTLWATFVTHWDDFCYPGSDDVTVWAHGRPWTLVYDHGEEFRFSAMGEVPDEPILAPDTPGGAGGIGIPESCGSCGAPVLARVSDTCVAGQLRWSASYRCGACGSCTELDDTGELPPRYRGPLLRAHGTWSLRLELRLESVTDQAQVASVLRRALSITAPEALALVRMLPGAIARGTNAEMTCLQRTLADAAVPSTLARTE